MDEDLKNSIKGLITLIDVLLIFAIIGIILKVGIAVGGYFLAKNAVKEAQNTVNSITTNTTNYNYRSNYDY